MELTCPKCHGPMRSYERNGVTVDQCTDCRGLFLDRGELDRLIDLEAGAAGRGVVPGVPSAGTRSATAWAGETRAGCPAGTGRVAVTTTAPGTTMTTAIDTAAATDAAGGVSSATCSRASATRSSSQSRC